MKNIRPTLRLLALAALGLTATWAMADRQPLKRVTADSITVGPLRWGEMPSGRMAQSAYPVQMAVKGRSLRVTSKHEQVLPIYTSHGTLYVAMQLTPGVNWLNGLPRGRYRINNRTIRIK